MILTIMIISTKDKNRKIFPFITKKQPSQAVFQPNSGNFAKRLLVSIANEPNSPDHPPLI